MFFPSQKCISCPRCPFLFCTHAQIQSRNLKETRSADTGQYDKCGKITKLWDHFYCHEHGVNFLGTLVSHWKSSQRRFAFYIFLHEENKSKRFEQWHMTAQVYLYFARKIKLKWVKTSLLLMKFNLMLSKCLSRSFSFSTDIAGNNNSSYVIRFNVYDNVSHVSFFSTHLTYPCSSLLSTNSRIFTEIHHGFHLFISV